MSVATKAKTTRGATPRKLPDPKAMALLGTVLRLTVRESDGREVMHSWERGSGPGLLWSPTLRALLFFPGLRLTDWHEIGRGPVERERRLDMKEALRLLEAEGFELPNPESTQAAAKLFTEWAARPSTRFVQTTIKPYPLQCDGEGVDIVYRSDKWNGRDGEEVDYIHHFSKSGTVKVSTAPGHPPQAFFVKGGRLTVNARGIIY